MNNAFIRVWNGLIKPAIKFCLLLLFMWAVFCIWLDFSNKQSWVLALLSCYGYYSIKELNQNIKREAEFIPYTVSIQIKNCHDLLLKHKIIKDEQEFKNLIDKLSDASLLRRGLNFTVLSLTPDKMPKLIWWADHKKFVTGLPSFHDSINEIKLPSCSTINWNWSPCIYFGYRHGKGNGYKIALYVQADWLWENKCEDSTGIEIVDTDDVDDDNYSGGAYITLATLPWGEISMDYIQRGQDREKELTGMGWKITDYYMSEMLNEHGYEIENEYFTLTRRECET